jgi:hypothetical protein
VAVVVRDAGKDQNEDLREAGCGLRYNLGLEVDAVDRITAWGKKKNGSKQVTTEDMYRR